MAAVMRLFATVKKIRTCQSGFFFNEKDPSTRKYRTPHDMLKRVEEWGKARYARFGRWHPTAPWA